MRSRWRASTERSDGIILSGLLLQTIFFTRVGFPSHPLNFRGVVERFYILPNVVLAVTAGLGAAFALERLRTQRPEPTGRDWP